MNKKPAEKMFELMDEVNYHVLWYEWFIRGPLGKEITKFDKMNKKQQLNFLKTEERKRRIKNER